MGCFSECVPGGNTLSTYTPEVSDVFPTPESVRDVLGAACPTIEDDFVMSSTVEQVGTATVGPLVWDAPNGPHVLTNRNGYATERKFFYGTGNPALYDEKGNLVREEVAGPAGLYESRSFSGGVYEEMYEASRVYRVYNSDIGNPKGAYFTTDKPDGSMQMQLDAALDPHWKNGQPNRVTTAKIVDGILYYLGRASSITTQVDGKRDGAITGSMPGGGSQVFVPDYKAGIIQLDDKSL